MFVSMIKVWFQDKQGHFIILYKGARKCEIRLYTIYSIQCIETIFYNLPPRTTHKHRKKPKQSNSSQIWKKKKILKPLIYLINSILIEIKIYYVKNFKKVFKLHICLCRIQFRMWPNKIDCNLSCNHIIVFHTTMTLNNF